MNGMDRQQSDHACLYFLSLVIWSCAFVPSITRNLIMPVCSSKQEPSQSKSNLPGLPNLWLLLAYHSILYEVTLTLIVIKPPSFFSHFVQFRNLVVHNLLAHGEWGICSFTEFPVRWRREESPKQAFPSSTQLSHECKGIHGALNHFDCVFVGWVIIQSNSYVKRHGTYG